MDDNHANNSAIT